MLSSYPPPNLRLLLCVPLDFAGSFILEDLVNGLTFWFYDLGVTEPDSNNFIKSFWKVFYLLLQFLLRLYPCHYACIDHHVPFCRRFRLVFRQKFNRRVPEKILSSWYRSPMSVWACYHACSSHHPEVLPMHTSGNILWRMWSARWSWCSRRHNLERELGNFHMSVNWPIVCDIIIFWNVL